MQTKNSTTKSIKQALYSAFMDRYGLTKSITMISVSASIALASFALLANTFPNNPNDSDESNDEETYFEKENEQ